MSQNECIHWAWELLTERLRMPKDRLYITYFGGCPEKGLGPDIEAKNFWLSLGYLLLNNILLLFLHGILTKLCNKCVGSVVYIQCTCFMYAYCLHLMLLLYMCRFSNICCTPICYAYLLTFFSQTLFI